MSDSEDVMAELIQESKEHLENIEPDLLEMESLGAETPEDMINKIFRAMHSIKGGFGFFNMTRIVQLAHVMENVLMQIRDGKLTVNSDITGALLDGADTLREMVEDVEQSESVEIQHHIDRLTPFVEGGAVPKAESKDEPEAKTTIAGIDQELIDLIKEQQAQGDLIYFVHYDLDDTSELEAELNSVGKIIKQAKLDQKDTMVVNTVMDIDMLNVMGLPATAIVQAPDASELSASEAEAPKVEDSASKKEADPSAKKSEAAPKKAPASKPADTLRVRTDLLSHLVDTAGEMVLGRNRVIDVINRDLNEIPGFQEKIEQHQELIETKSSSILNHLENALTKEQSQLLEKELKGIQEASQTIFKQKITDASGVGAIFQGFSRISSDLQNGIMGLRLQPVSSVFSKFPRVIRDMNKKLGKEIELVIEGEEVELDKSVIEGLGDPLTHLVRNSCDHGVERPDDREANGKPRKGIIKLIAKHEGGQVHIVITDDGAGINTGRIKEKALENKMFTQEQIDEMPDKEIFLLIFAAGFSTAKEVSDVSGRGVGMDVVRTNIEKLGGRIEIDSSAGLGTTLTLILPLTLAIIPSLGVTVADQHYAIPQVSIDELVRVSADEVADQIATVSGSPVLKLRSTLLPLIRLSDVLDRTKWIDGEQGKAFPDRRTSIADRRSEEFDFSKSKDEEEKPSRPDRRSSMYNRLYIVVLKSAGSRYGLIVDKLHEPQEVVVKPLSSRLKSVKIFSGATIKSDGKVSMILDADGIAQDSEMRLTELSQDDDRYDYANIKEAQSMLEFTCGTQDSFALNLSMVSRVHRIMPGQLHQTAGQEFLKHDGTSLRVIRLSDHIKLSEPEADHDFQYVLIPKLIKNPMGILIDKPVGVFETDEALDTEKINEVGVHGTLIIDEKFMIFLDLYSLFNKVSPEKIEAQISASSIENMRVLYAEDTALFRTVVSKFLKELKFGQVDVVNDGQLGWDQLKRENYDLLVTDIVMPNMNGMELAQKVRMDDSMKDLPIIAVTSLANESDKKKILASGVDIYLQKLDRDGLNKAIIKLLSPSSKATA